MQFTLVAWTCSEMLGVSKSSKKIDMFSHHINCEYMLILPPKVGYSRKMDENLQDLGKMPSLKSIQMEVK